MKKTRSECIDTARQALNLFTGEELEAYLKQVSSETRKLAKDGVPFPRNAAIKAANKTHLEALLDDSARSARDMVKWDINKSKMDKGIKPKSFLDKTAKNTDANIETAGNAAKQTLHRDAFGEMTKEELEILESAEMDDEIYAVADGQEHSDPMIKKSGDSLREYIDPRNAHLIKSDAMKPEQMNKDRFFSTMYNPSMMADIGKENWIPLHKSFIDIEKTFENTLAMNLEGEIDEAIVDEMVGNTFDNVIEGNGVLFTRATVSKDADKIERSRHIFYKFKDWKSWGAANKAYGQGSLMKAWMNDINTSGQQIGMAEIMGTQPQKMWLKMREEQVKKSPPTSFDKLEYQQSDALFNNLLGVNKGAYDPRAANVFASIRSLSSMARLAKIVFKSIPDISNTAGASMRAGMGYWSTYFDSVINAFNLMPSDIRTKLAKDMAFSLNVHAGTASRYVETSGFGETINRFSNKFFYRLGLTAWDNGNRLSAMAPIMKGYGRQSTKSFDGLNLQQQAYLKRFSITESEWDGLRSKTEKGMFSIENVDNLSDAEIRTLWNDSDKVTPLSDYRSTLYRKVFAMFDTAQEFSVLNPNAYQNMMTTWNTRPGTIGGEAIRMVMQFKGYPIQYMRRIFVGGMQDFDSYQARMMYALNMALGTVALASLSEVLVAISNNLTPPNPAHMSRGEQVKYYGKMLAGGLGVFGTAMDNDNAAKSMIFTPSIELVRQPFVSAMALVRGDLKGSQAAVKKWASVANPIATLPFVSPFVDAIMGTKPFIEPGQRPLI